MGLKSFENKREIVLKYFASKLFRNIGNTLLLRLILLK